MDTISIEDKNFKISLKQEIIEARVGELCQQISKDYKDMNPIFLVILNGAFIFASDLAKGIDIQAEFCFLKLSSYNGLNSTNQVKSLIGFNQDISNRHIVVVEDIIDTGVTMESIKNQLEAKNPASVKLATLLHKPSAFQKDYPIDYIGFEIPNDFIVGYGLDYNEYGRNLKNIYTLINN